MANEARVREIALLPCPFCGGDAKIGAIRDGARVYCKGCHASGAPAFNPGHIEGARVKWNTRAALPAGAGITLNTRDICDSEMRKLLSATDVGKGRAILKQIIDRLSTTPQPVAAASIKIETPKQPGDRPPDGPFNRAHFSRLADEWSKMKNLPEDGPCWNLDHFQWNGVEAALKIAASTPSSERERALEEAVEREICSIIAACRREADKPFTGYAGSPIEALEEFRKRIRAMKGGDGWQPTHRHRRSGGDYRHLGRARLQTDLDLGDNDVVEVYEAKDGTLWARRSAEFEDRFDALVTTKGGDGAVR